MDKERKVTWLLASSLVLCVFVGSVFAFIYKKDRESIRPIDLGDTIAITNDDVYFYGIDPIEIENGILHINGWIANKEKDLTYINRLVVLIDDEGNAYALKTIAHERGLTGYFNTGYNYDDGGMLAQGSLKTIPKGKNYHVKFLMIEDGVRYLFDLNTVVNL